MSTDITALKTNGVHVEKELVAIRAQMQADKQDLRLQMQEVKDQLRSVDTAMKAGAGMVALWLMTELLKAARGR